MLGQIHCVIRDLVDEKYGQKKWEEVLKASGLDAEDHFLMFKRYPDDDTLALVVAVSTTLSVPVDVVLHIFGDYFLTYCMRHGYDKMLTTLGEDLVSFIQNLDSLHCLLSYSYAGMEAPSFRKYRYIGYRQLVRWCYGILGRNIRVPLPSCAAVKEIRATFPSEGPFTGFQCVQNNDGTLALHYYSTRHGLYPIVMGVIEAVGRELFHQTATLTLDSQSKEEMGHRTVNHAVIMVKVEDMPEKKRDWLRSPCLSPVPIMGSLPCGPGAMSLIGAEDFSVAFPYHILLDTFLTILQCGDSLKKLSHVTIRDGTLFQEVGVIIQPIIVPTLENIVKFINSVFVIAIHRRVNQEPFVIKGEMIWLSCSNLLLFIGSPRIRSLEDFKEIGMYLADIPVHDVTRELILLNQQRLAEIDVAKKLNETSKALEEERRKTEHLLHEMLPKKITQQLTRGQRVKGEHYESCTVLFSDIVGFTDIAARCPANDIVNMLNFLYYVLDVHADAFEVYKVETIGDAYMAVTGVPDIQDDHAARMADFAMDMLVEASSVTSPATGLPLKIRVGMHSGSVVAGVIGRKKPRYDIYGDTVNTASRMESNSVPGRIHVSITTFQELYRFGFKLKARGEIPIKGKGMMKTYFLVGSANRDVVEPEDEFTKCDTLFDPSAILRTEYKSQHGTVTVPKINIVTVESGRKKVSRHRSSFVIRIFPDRKTVSRETVTSQVDQRESITDKTYIGRAFRKKVVTEKLPSPAKIPKRKCRWCFLQ